MQFCSACGHELGPLARFCEACGAPLTAAPANEQRKTVTVLFCDLTGSTALGESLDPEPLRALLARYFERMKGIVERHGGTVEKFIGDAVMAVFGVPQVHEDDALRACRAAVEMRDALPELGVQARIGVNTGEVVTGTQERLVTVVGDAGVGKSRLTVEFLSALEARAVRGRCLPYGEGITYWPVVEVVKQLDALPSDPEASASMRSLLGESEQGTSAEEIAWAFRKLLEEQAPLVCLFDDIQWGEENFLDLVDGVSLLSSGAPLLLLCLARSELVDRRTQWPVALRLEPLPEQEVDDLIPQAVAPELRKRITHASGGNPLFVTEMVAVASESRGDVAVPPTLKAVLAARLAQLEPAERSVLERGAVEGEIFHRGAVQALSKDGLVTPRLAALVRKEFIRPDKAQLPGDDAFRFRHLLIRDAAYDVLPKSTRAELHERYADWLKERGRDLVELDELLGYHLEQAAKYTAELGQTDPALAERAGGRLAAAGRRAAGRGDLRAAVSLLERALALLRPLRSDVSLALELARAVNERWQSVRIAEEAAERADVAGDEPGAAVPRAHSPGDRPHLGVVGVDEVEDLARTALPLLEGDHANLVSLFYVLGSVASFHGRFDEWAQAAEQSLHHARLAGERPSHLFSLGPALTLGPRPADEALRRMD